MLPKAACHQYSEVSSAFGEWEWMQKMAFMQASTGSFVMVVVAVT